MYGAKRLKQVKSNPLVQILVVSLMAMIMLAVGISFMLTAGLNRNIDLLKDHGDAMMAGEKIRSQDPFFIPSLTNDVNQLQLITFGTVGGTFLILYRCSITIVWRGWKTIEGQKNTLTAANA